LALRELIAIFGIKVDSKELKGAEKNLDDFVGKLKNFGSLIAGGAVGAGAAAFVNHVAKVGDEIGDTAERLGVSTDALQAFGLAAQLGGSSAEAMAMSLGMLNDKIGDAARGGASAKEFAKLGIAFKDANGEIRPTEEVMEDAADKISKLKTTAEKTTAAMNLFGRPGKQLVPLLSKGSKGLEEMRKQMKALGGGFSKEGVKASGDFADAMDKLSVVGNSWLSGVAVKILPTVQKMVEWFSKASVALLEMANKSNIFQAVLVTLGAVMAVFAINAAIASAPLLLMALAIAAIVLVVDELITLFEGGDTLIGETIDKIFGKGSSTELVKEVKELWNDIGLGIKAAYDWVMQYSEEIRAVADVLGKIVKFSTLPIRAVMKGSEAVGDYFGKQAAESTMEAASSLGPKSRGGFAFGEGGGLRPSVSAPMSMPRGGGIVQNNTPTYNITTNNPEDVRRMIEQHDAEQNMSVMDVSSKHTDRRPG
jgi:TP901 family phage tail tape measure protein